MINNPFIDNRYANNSFYDPTRGFRGFHQKQTAAQTPEQQCLAQGGRWDPITKTCILGNNEDQAIAEPSKSGVMDLPGQANQAFNPDINYENAFVASNGQLVGTLPDGTRSASDFPIGSSSGANDMATPYALPDGASSLKTNQYGNTISEGYDVGQVDPRLSQAAGYSQPANKADALKNGHYGVALELGATPEEIESAGGPSVPVIASVIANIIGESAVGKVVSAITGKPLGSTITNSALRSQVLNELDNKYSSSWKNKTPVFKTGETREPLLTAQKEKAVNDYADKISKAHRTSNDDDGPSHAEIIRSHQAAQVARDNNETSRTDSSGKETWSSKVARGGGFNSGGRVGFGQRAFNTGGAVGQAPQRPMSAMNDGGPMANHPFDREGEHFDTVEAKLTPGEFVIDADSTHVFQPILEKINQWEPGDDVKLGGLLSRKGEKMTITKDLGNGRKMSVTSGEDDEMSMADAEGMLAVDPEEIPVNANLGRKIGGFLKDAVGREAQRRLNEKFPSAAPSAPAGAPTMGLMRKPGFDAQRQRAMQAAAAQRSAAHRNAGLQGLGRGQDALASQLGGAGMRTTSTGSWGPGGYRGATFAQNAPGETDFSGQLQAAGQGFQEAANADEQLASDLNTIDQTQMDQAREDQIRQEDREAEQEAKDSKTSEEDKSKLTEAKNIREDIISTMEAVDKARPAFSAYKDAQITANRAYTAASIIPGVNEKAIGEARDLEVERFMREKAGTEDLSQEAYNAWKEMDQRIKRLAQLILNTQSGTKTDFDFQVSAAQIADTSGNADSILHNLGVALAGINREIEQLGESSISAPSFGGAENNSASAATSAPSTSAKNWNYSGGSGKGLLSGKASDLVKQGQTLFGDLVGG